ncbi:hypothetical protein F5051DRAFT_106596 [Lentinula edodes]|nr:hypothetical protein F5051DRAFT_106596 [Lentinula edodes]
MASGPPTNARVNPARTRPDIGFGQRIRNGTADSNSARPSPAPARKTSFTQSATASRISPNPASSPIQRPVQSLTPAGPSRSTYNSQNDPKITTRLLSSSKQTLSTRSPTTISPSRIARPRAISTTLPSTPTVIPSRLRTMSSINPSTKLHRSSPTPAGTKSLNTSSTHSAAPRTSPSLTPSPRPQSRPTTRPNVKSRITPAHTKPVDDCTSRHNLRGSGLEAEQKRKTQPAQPSQHAKSENTDSNASGLSENLGLSPQEVNVLQSVWEDSPVNTDVSFDPGGSSIVDRTAVKSGYGSIFGFNMVPKSRNSFAVTEGSSEDRSQSASSIGSTLSRFSLVSTKTVAAGPPSPVNPPTLQTTPQYPSSTTTQSSSPSVEVTHPASIAALEFPSEHSMLQSSFAPLSQSSSLSPDSLDVYAAVQYLRTSVSTSALRSGAPSGNADVTASTSRVSGSTSRVSLHATAHPTPKLTASAHVNPSTRVSIGSSRASSTAKGSSPLQAKDSNVSVTKTRMAPVATTSGYPPTPLHTDGTVVHRATSRTEGSMNHIHPTELSSMMDVMTSPSSYDMPSSHSSYGQRYTSNTSLMSSDISPSSPFSLPVDSPVHSYPPPASSPPTVNLKRLLSKPAPTGNSSASESESGVITTKSRPVRRIERIEEKNEKQRIEAFSRGRAIESDAEYAPPFGSSRERDRARKMEWEAERRLLKERTLSHSRPTTSQSTDSSQTKERKGLGGLVRSASWSRTRGHEGTDKAEKKTRNTLKRHPSATSVASPSDDFKMKEFPYSSFAPAYTGSILPATRPAASSGSLLPPAVGLSSSRGSSPTPQDKRRSLIPHSALLKQGLAGTSSDDGVTSSGTTPAKEIMIAYKQQQEREKKRERERNERAREKQREKELWQQEDDRQQRALKDQASPSHYNQSNSLTTSHSQSIFMRDVPSVGMQIHPRERSSSVPNSGAASMIHDSSHLAQSSDQSPSRPEKLLNEARSFDEEPSQPYYTVLGSSKRVVAAEGVKIEDTFSPDFSLSTSNLVEGISSSMGVGLGLGQPSSSPQSEIPRLSTQTWERSASVTVGKPSKTSGAFGIGIGKTLSRKMSGRLGAPKRGPSLDISPLSNTPTLPVHEHGMPSLHERRVMPKNENRTSGSRGDKRSLRLSIDDYATTKGAISPPKKSPAIHRPVLTQDGEFRTSLLKSSLTSSPQPSPTSSSSHSGSKNKIWNLMKRISTGGLRDNYRDNGASLPTSPLPPPPPVPALPKDLSVYSKEMTQKGGEDVTEVLHKRNATSTTIHSPYGKLSSAGSIKAPMIPSTSTRSGTATRSSSPISSSDIGSSKFFNRSQSQRSSSSSYGEQIPPVPTAPGKTFQLQQHILPPSELYQLHLNLERNKDDPNARPMNSSNSTNYSHSLSSLNTSISHSRSQVNLKLQTQTQQKPAFAEEWTIIPTPKEEKAGFSLPVPRRRTGSDNIDEVGSRRPPTAYENSRSPSPTIAQFSTENTINSLTSVSSPSRQTKPSGSALTSTSTDASSAYRESASAGSRFSSLPVIPSKSPRRAASASSASLTSSGRTWSPAIPPLPTPHVTTSVSGHQRPQEEYVKPDADSPSRRGMRKSFGFSSPSESSSHNYIRKRTISSSSRPTTSPADYHPLTTAQNRTTSRLPRSENLQRPNARTFGPLSAKEKDDKWDDLLERSKRAGGTLHLNGGLDGLDSDRLRFSVNDSEDEHDL